MPDTVTRDDPKLTADQMLKRIKPFSTKMAFFSLHGYEPHYYQTLFHTARNPDTHQLARFRSLAAGRRGGKTISAAEEVAFYMEFPEEFHKDVHGKTDDRSLHVYALTENYKRLLPAYRAFKEALQRHGLDFRKDVKERIADKTFEFANGSLIEFRSADNPDSLRGAGLDILWMDEAAFMRSDMAYRVVRPALGDKQGIVINTTTPDRQNWFYDTFWSGKALTNPRHFRVAYWSLDNPYYPTDEWEQEKADTHPMMFAQEYMASFDSMKGNALSPDWLHYWDGEGGEGVPKNLEKYIGVDPAISISDNADEFVMSLIGIDRTTNMVYLLEQYHDRIPFPEQVEKINEWWVAHNPISVGIETVAYQAALAQQVNRLDNFIPVQDIPAKGKKFERIMGMSPLFKAKRILISRYQTQFIDEWLNYDPSMKNPKDDCLDSVEIALRTAAVLLTPSSYEEPLSNDMLVPTLTSQQAADRRTARMRENRPGTNSLESEFDNSLM